MVVRSGGGVLCIAALQVLIGLCLLGIYEGYKTKYLRDEITVQRQESDMKDDTLTLEVANGGFRTPFDFVFYLSIASNVFSVLGLAGVLNQQKELVTAFFTYSTVQMVVVFHYFVDVCADVGIRFKGQSQSLDSYAQAAAAFLFFNFVLSVAATAFAIRAIDEIRTKQREQYQRMAVLSDTLQFEADTSA